MENEILELVRNINTDLEEKGFPELSVHLLNSGFYEAVALPELLLSHDDESNYSPKSVLSTGYVYFSTLEKIFRELLSQELSAYFQTNLQEPLKLKFPNSRLTYFKKSKYVWSIVVSGEYNENTMDEFLGDFETNFLYDFPHLKLETHA